MFIMTIFLSQLFVALPARKLKIEKVETKTKIGAQRKKSTQL